MHRYPRLPPVYPRSLDSYRSPLVWEKAWQKTFARTYHGLLLSIRNRLSPDTDLEPMPNPLAALLTFCGGQDVLAFHRWLVADAMHEIIETLATKDFHRTWDTLSVAQRRAAILQGLCNMEDPFGGDQSMLAAWMRVFCPESSLRMLSARGGNGFLDLMHAILPSDIETIGKSPPHIPNPVMDNFIEAMFQEDNLVPRSLKDTMYYIRALYLAVLVVQVIRITLSREPWTCPVRPVLLNNKTLATRVPQMGADMRETLLVLTKFAERETGRRSSCYVCHRTQPLSAFKLCGRCSSRGWRVLYCSRECQRYDWKHGKPYPHRDTCGKGIMLPEAIAQPSVLSKPAKLPKADNGFKPSPALLLQLIYLREDQSLDYVVRDAKRSMVNKYRVILPLTESQRKPIRHWFLVMRNRAFRNGDPIAVRAVYAMLCRLLQEGILDEEERTLRMGLLRSQLEAEYGIVVEAVPTPLSDIPKPTDQDLAELELLLSA